MLRAMRYGTPQSETRRLTVEHARGRAALAIAWMNLPRSMLEEIHPLGRIVDEEVEPLLRAIFVERIFLLGLIRAAFCG
jgi:hypothetical protein